MHEGVGRSTVSRGGGGRFAYFIPQELVKERMKEQIVDVSPQTQQDPVPHESVEMVSLKNGPPSLT